MASRDEIRIPIVADPAPAEAGFEDAAKAAEKYTVKVSTLADKNVKKQVEQFEAIKKQAEAYAKIARSAEESSAEQIAALKKLEDQMNRLARATGGDAEFMKRALGGIKDSANDTADAMGKVKLGDKNAAETDVVAAAIDARLSKIKRKAEETHRSLLGVRLSGLGGLLTGGIGALGAVGGLASFGPAALGLGLGGAAMATPLVGAGAVGMLALSGGQLAKKLGPELKPLEDILKRLKTLAINDLVPAFTKALKTLDKPALIKAMSIVVNDFAIALGKVANIIAKYLSSKGFAVMMAEWAKAGSQILPILVKSAIVLGDTLGKLLLAFMPLAKWLSTLLLQGLQWIDQQVTLAKKTGELAKIVNDCKVAITGLGKILKVFFQGVGVVIEAVKKLYGWFKDLVGQKASIIAMIVAVGAALTLTLGPTAAAVVGVVAAIGLIKDHWKTLKTDFINGIKIIGNFFITNLVNPMISGLNKIISAYNHTLGRLFGKIGSIGSLGLLGQHSNANKGMTLNPKANGSAGSIVSEAKTYGVGSGGTYQWGGGHAGVVKPGSKLDCSGYVWQVFTAAGFKGFPQGSVAQWHTMSGPNWASEVIRAQDAKPGDVVFMVGGDPPPPGHVGIIVGGTASAPQIMQYYQSGKPPDAPVGWPTDVIGIKRFFLIKKGAAGGSGSGSGGGGNILNTAPPLPKHGTSLTAPKATHHHHKTAAQIATAHARNVITALLGTSAAAKHESAAQNAATLALAHASAAMKAASKTKDPVKQWKDYERAYKDYAKAKQDEQKALKAEEVERRKLREDIKHSTGKAKQLYEVALKKVNKNIANTQAKIVAAGQDMATATADKLALVTTMLQNIETAADAQFQAAMAPLQAQINALQQQQTAANDAFNVSNAQTDLAAAIASGDTNAIAKAQNALSNAKTQQTIDNLQTQINAIQANEDKFNTAIEALIAKINGTDSNGVMGGLNSLIGSFIDGKTTLDGVMTSIAKFVNNTFPGANVPAPSSSNSSSSGGGGGGGSCFVAGTPVITPDGSKSIEQFEVGDQVVTWSFSEARPVVSKVKEVHRHEDDDARQVLAVKLSGGTEVLVTAEHPFYTGRGLGADGWTPAGELERGSFVWAHSDLLLEMEVVVAITPLDGTHNVYNLTVEREEYDDQNYFADGVLVHNVKAMAAGGIVTRPTFALVGEKGPEAVIPLNRTAGLGGNLHIHIDGTVIGSDLTKAGKELAEPIYRELLRKTKRNTGLGLY